MIVNTQLDTQSKQNEDGEEKNLSEAKKTQKHSHFDFIILPVRILTRTYHTLMCTRKMCIWYMIFKFVRHMQKAKTFFYTKSDAIRLNDIGFFFAEAGDGERIKLDINDDNKREEREEKATLTAKNVQMLHTQYSYWNQKCLQLLIYVKIIKAKRKTKLLDGWCFQLLNSFINLLNYITFCNILIHSWRIRKEFSYFFECWWLVNLTSIVKLICLSCSWWKTIPNS